MKKFLPFLASLFLASVSWGQTGNGVLLLTDASYTYTPTTVDSSMTFNLSLKNDVGIAQIVYFGGLDAPFELSSDAPIEVPSQDTVDFSITFTPSAIGTFSDTLEVVGNVFGSASLVLSGDGIQVQLEWEPDTLAFDTTAIGQTNSQTLTLYSVGDGAGVISDIEFSNDIFFVDSALSTFTIAEDTTETIVVNYAPVNAGSVAATMTLHTNDPTNATIEIALTAVGISEVSGEICDITWTLINSPYTLVGDVTVPEGCTLVVEAGVEVLGSNFIMDARGTVIFAGTQSNSTIVDIKDLVLSQSSNVSLNHTHLTEFDNSATADSLWWSTSELSSTNGEVQFSSLFNNENSESHIGRYYEGFDDSQGQGWSFEHFWPSSPQSTQGGCSISETFGGEARATSYDCNSSSYYGYVRIYSPTFELVDYETPVYLGLKWDTYNPNWGYNSSYIDSEIQFRINDEADWSTFYFTSNFRDDVTQNWSFEDQLPNFDWSDVNKIQFRIQGYFRYTGRVEVDQFDFRTSLYPGSDVSAPLLTEEAQGNLILLSSSWSGQASTDSLYAENSVITGSEYGAASNGVVARIALLYESEVSGHRFHGLQLTNQGQAYLYDCDISNNGRSGIHALANAEILANSSSIYNNGFGGIRVNGANGNIHLSECSLTNNEDFGMSTSFPNSQTLFGCTIANNFGSGVIADDNSQVEISFSLIDSNIGNGLEIGDNGAGALQNTRVYGNGALGIYSGSALTISHCNLAFNDGTGLTFEGNNFHTLNNSILWGNNSSNYTQIDIDGGVISTSYSTVQGRSSYGTSGSGQYYWGEGVIEADPLFADDDLHLEIFSPCVDGGQPWHQDAYMPFGLGGVRADMGMYGGPDNAYWGGEALPDGASALTGVSDSPQDQGGVVGLVFDASFYDNSDLVNNVTSYAFWRHYDPTGQSIGTLDEGNWELIGEMPAQSFNGYAYQAQTLGNTNAFGTFNSCYTVVAHTDDPDTYWYSNVLCGESVDNLAPMEPELAGMVLETGGVTVFWELPAEEDYAYTEVTSDVGFEAEVTGDTLAVDLSAELGGTYTYTAVHYDVNGNASDPSSVTLAVAAGSDIVTLNAGWNLISTDREETLNVEDVFAGLTPGNLQYVTGFDGGVQFYDPNGLSFLNTLNALTPGMGYWVKVAADDVLEVNGARLDEGFMPALAEGWNLIGYAPEAPQAPGTFFAELEAAGDLLYVTGFDQGTQLYNPNGLPFLNTLAEMRNGYGYWVKSAAATEAGVFSPLADNALLAEQPTPLYDVVNGVSELKSYAGEFVDVLNGWGVTVARLPILEGGHLMTTVLFGDDPATAAVEGLVAGETLHFAFRGAMANETLVFGGDMAHKTLSLTFDEVGAAMGVFPNPASDVATFRFQVDMDAQVEVTLIDLAGRQVAVLLNANKGQGAHAETLALPALEAGAYTVQLRVAGEVTGTQRLVITH